MCLYCWQLKQLSFFGTLQFSKSNSWSFLPDIAYLKTVLSPTVEEEFYSYLKNIKTDSITLCAVDEGSVVFPRVPLIRLEGPLPGTVPLVELEVP